MNTQQEVLELIADIENVQKQRWKRIHFWRQQTTLPLAFKHTMLRTELRLLRAGKGQLAEAKFILKQIQL